MPFHYTTKLKKPDGIFHVRLYSLPANYVVNYKITAHAGMPAHMEFLRQIPETKFSPELVPSGGIGKLAEAYEDQLFRSTTSFQNFALTLSAHPIFGELVKEIRSGEEIWCEIALEQSIDSLPPPPAFTMFAPRKNRLYFWGKLLLQEAKGHVKFQELNPESLVSRNNFISRQDARDHYGTLSLTFIHWFKALGAQNPKAFLDSFAALHIGIHNSKARWSQFLEAMIQWIQPTYFHAASDQRLQCVGKLPDNPADPSRCNFLLSVFYAGSSGYNYGTLVQSGTILNGINDLYHIGFSVTNGTGTKWGLFDNPADTSQRSTRSLYNFPTFADLFVNFCEDVQLKCQIELPTMEESYYQRIPSGLPDNTNTREAHWEKCSRWLFFDARASLLQGGGTAVKLPKNIYFTAEDDKVDYQPRPLWLGKLEIKDATCDIFEFGTNRTNESHHYIFGTSADGAIDLSINTLFCFVDTLGTNLATATDDPRGPEVLLFDDFSGWAYARRESIPLSNGGTVTGSSYSLFYLTQFWNLWGPHPGTSIIEVDCFGIGIEPFGASADNLQTARDYKLLDFGEFPMFRTFQANPGILFDAHTAEDFRIISIERTPGETQTGTTHLKAMLRGDYIQQVPDVPPVSDPPVPPVINPPSFVEPICGIINFIFGVLYGDDICGVSATVDGIPVPAMAGGNSGNITPVFVTVNGCVLAVGIHTICVTVIPCDTRVAPVTNCWLFTVNHNCC